MLLTFIALTFFFVTTSSSPVKCVETAPYNLHQTSTVLAIHDIAEQGQSWYEYRLSSMIENLALLPASEVGPALDVFMQVFCEEPYFKGFIGITGDNQLITNRSLVRELYKDTAMAPGTHIPFNVKTYNHIFSIDPYVQTGHESVYVNVTAFYEVVLRVGGSTGYLRIVDLPKTDDANFLLVNGYYRNEFRVDSNGNVCISGFMDQTKDINLLPHTNLLAMPWDLPILDLP